MKKWLTLVLAVVAALSQLGVLPPVLAPVALAVDEALLAEEVQSTLSES